MDPFFNIRVHLKHFKINRVKFKSKRAPVLNKIGDFFLEK